MTIIQMRYFLEICKQGTLSKAATSLYISQPALTLAIRDLEKRLGIRIFKRVGKSLVLTLEGEFLREKLGGLLKNLDLILDEINGFSNNKKYIRLAMPAMTSSWFTPVILGEFKKEHPDIRVDIAEVSSVKALQMLEQEEVELVLTTYKKAHIPSLLYLSIFESEFYFCTNKANPLAQHQLLNIHDVSKEPLALLQGGYIVEQLFEEASVQPNIIFRSKQLHTIKKLVANNIASALLPKDIVENDQDIVAVPLKNPLKFYSGIVTKKGLKEYNDVKMLIAFLLKSFKK